MLLEQLCIPTLNPRPLDCYDKTARKYYRALNARHDALAWKIERAAAAQCKREKLDLCEYLHELARHGRIVAEWARFM